MVGKVSRPFDEAKYKALLEGLEISVLKLSDVLGENEKLRIDGEYFGKEYLSKLKTIEEFGITKIKDFCYVTDGIHESIDFSTESNINLISAKSPKENIFDLSNNHHISKEQHLKNPRTTLKKGDVIVSTVGTIGNCAVVDESILPANSDRHVGIIRIERMFSPYVVSTFLLSKYGRFQTLRESTGNVQLNLFIYKIRELKIPNYSDKFQNYIEKIVLKGHSNLQTSKNLYTTAEDELLTTLGLSDYQPSTENVQVKSLKDSFLSSGRLDAEYFQPKYEEVEEKIKNYGSVKIREVFYQNVERIVFDKDGYNYIEISDINVSDGKATSSYRLTEDLPANAKIKIQKGDLLISKVRPNRGAVSIIDINKENLVASGAFTVLREKNGCLINKETLQTLLRTKVYKELLLKYNCGSSYPVIKDQDVLNLNIPLVQKELQTKISNAIQRSFKLKTQSKQLLHIAKTGVEKAIEESEAAAMAWMEAEIEKLQ